MISVIITAWKEPQSVSKSIAILRPQLSAKDEIIVVAPDVETLDVARKFSRTDRRIKICKDKRLGKPAAMNIAVKEAKGDILVWTDGDVFTSGEAIKELIAPFKDKGVGAVTGRPISKDNKETKYGFWAYMLSDIAHKQRLNPSRSNQTLFCSGYLFAIRKKLMPPLPEDLLSEDGYISHKVYQKGNTIAYAPKSEVYISYPKNFSDWIKQKRRSVGGYAQNYKLLNVKIRSFSKESRSFYRLFHYIQKPKHVWWLLQLFIARLHLWGIIYWDINIKKKTGQKLWDRIESTK
ncbi:MAG: glycosyltransferase [Candidatus Pacearchaeota archaeon]